MCLSFYHIMAPQLKASFKCICLASARISGYAKSQAERWSWFQYSLPEVELTELQPHRRGTHRENTTSRAQQHNDIKLGHETCCEELKNTELLTDRIRIEVTQHKPCMKHAYFVHLFMTECSMKTNSLLIEIHKEVT